MRITLYSPSVSVAHSTQSHFSHRFSSTHRPQRPIYTLSCTHSYHSYTHRAAHHLHHTCTSMALTSPCTPHQTAQLTLYTCTWTGGPLSGVLALGTRQPCPAGRWLLSLECYSARLVNTSVEVSFHRRFLFAKLMHFAKIKPQCVAYPNRSTLSHTRLALALGGCHPHIASSATEGLRPQQHR